MEKHGSVQSRKRYGHIPCLWLMSCRTKNASKTFANIGSRHAQLLIAVCPRGGLGSFPVHVTIFCLLNIFRPSLPNAPALKNILYSPHCPVSDESQILVRKDKKEIWSPAATFRPNIRPLGALRGTGMHLDCKCNRTYILYNCKKTLFQERMPRVQASGLTTQTSLGLLNPTAISA